MPKSRSEHLHGTLDALILKTLSWGPRHGYAIARWQEERSSSVLKSRRGRFTRRSIVWKSAAGSRRELGAVGARPARKVLPQHRARRG
jgi:hypothetical protein